MNAIVSGSQGSSVGVDLWSEGNISSWKKQFAASKIHKHIVKNARLYRYFRRMIFVKWKTTERIMKNWRFLKILMKLA